MTYTFKETGGAAIEEVLAFVEKALGEGSAAAVPAASLPLLARDAGCSPRRNGEAAGCFVFRDTAGQKSTCGFFERTLAALALVVLSPLIGVFSVLILLCNGAPVLFRQTRYGKDGAPFTIFKFRTMVRRSERLHDSLQLRVPQTEFLFKLEHDPRVTRLGRFLRRTFLDELPQLINVVKGQMRIVGPRPLPESDGNHYTKPGHALRLRGMPGMTGLWQVSGRNRRSFDEMCLLDCYYLSNRSLALDVRIVWRTACLLFKQIGLERET